LKDAFVLNERAPRLVVWMLWRFFEIEYRSDATV
jgi:hypothetical protein